MALLGVVSHTFKKSHVKNGVVLDLDGGPIQGQTAAAAVVPDITLSACSQHLPTCLSH